MTRLFFSVAYGAEISSLTIQGELDVSNSGYVFFGTVAGVAENSKISDCVSDVSFTDTNTYVNGTAALCGYAITQRNENLDRRPAQRLLPGGQGQRRVRALLPRPRHGPTAGRTVGTEMDGRRPRPWCAENPTGHLTAEQQGSRGPTENEKRLPHTAIVGRCDKRSDATKKKNG